LRLRLLPTLVASQFIRSPALIRTEGNFMQGCGVLIAGN
jgi:hypothetical protein